MNSYKVVYSVVLWSEEDKSNPVYERIKPDKATTVQANYIRSAKPKASKWMLATTNDKRLAEEPWLDLKPMSYKSYRFGQIEHILTIQKETT